MDPKSKLVLLFLSASLTMGLVSQAVKNNDAQAQKLPSKKINHETNSDHLKANAFFSGRG